MKLLFSFVLMMQFLYANEIVFLDKENGIGRIEFSVKKNIDQVMQEIVNFKAYPQKIEDVQKVEIYLKSNDKINATLYISTFFIDFHNSVIHEIDYKNHTVKWHLDKTKENYFKVMNGFWKLKQDGNMTKVIYQNQLKFKGWIPSFLENYLLKKGLRKSIEWI